MKPIEVMETLGVARSTVSKYRDEGLIEGVKLPNGRWDYDEESVYGFLNKGVPRMTVVYARVSTSKQKKDLENQIESLKLFCLENGWTLNRVYSDVVSGISFEGRTDFFKMLDEILNKRVQRVVISYKDRLSRVDFELFSTLFKKFGCEIVVVSEIGSQKLDSEEVFEEIVSLLHCYSMKLYSKRKKQTVKELIKE